MEDETTIGACEECGLTEYLRPLHGRRLCDHCAVRTTVPLVVPEPLPLRPHTPDPEEFDMSITNITNGTPKGLTATWIAILFGAFIGITGYMNLAYDNALVRQENISVSRRLGDIEKKIDLLLSARDPRFVPSANSQQ